MINSDDSEEKEKDLQLIQRLVKKLPWILVGVVAIAVIFTILQLFISIRR